MNCWIIGDIHGCAKTLEALLANLPSDEPKVFTGDLIDRGPNSRRVVEIAIENNFKSVLGNHELFALSVMRGGKWRSGWGNDGYLWIKNGGNETNDSYGTGHISDEHLDWMESLPLYLEFPELKGEDGRHLFVSHSAYHELFENYSIDDIGLWDEYNSIVWNRRKVHPSTTRYYVHGHSVCYVTVGKDFTNIDGGCVYHGADERKGGKFVGKLTALRWPDLKLVQQVNIDQSA